MAACPRPAASSGTPPTHLFANSSVSLPESHPRLIVLFKGLSGVSCFSLLTAWFTWSQPAEFLFKLLIVHLLFLSIVPQFLVDKAHGGQELPVQSREGRVGVEKLGLGGRLSVCPVWQVVPRA